MKFVLFFLCIAISFLTTYIILPYWIKRAIRAGLKGKDMNKYKKPEVAEVGGIAVVVGILAGVLLYIAIKTFGINQVDAEATEIIKQILAFVCTLLIITIIGFTDDILGWKIGLRQHQKPILCLLAAIPLAVINAGESSITLPLLGTINVWLLYPLLIVPIAITGASNGFNMLAGYNGLEAGMGIIILSTLGVFQIGPSLSLTWVGIIAFSSVAALFAFLMYNKFPAKIFPGDTLTYSIGAIIASVAILGNIEKVALILFIPYFLELFLKIRGGLRKESFAIPKKDGSLEINGVYGLEHLMILLLKKIKPSKKVYETDVVYSIWFLEILISVILIWIYLI
ncbi:MAG: glycosyltransferase 4 family protein [archaeon]